MKVARSITAEDGIDTLAELVATSVPERIRRGNGPEVTAKSIRHWMEQLGVEALSIDPKPPLRKRMPEERPRQTPG